MTTAISNAAGRSACLARKFCLYLILAWLPVLSGRASEVREFLFLSGPGNEIYRQDVPWLTAEQLHPVRAGADPVNLIDAGDGRLYTIDRASNSLVTLDRSSGEFIALVSLDRDVLVTRRGFALSPDGVLYGVFPGMELRMIDPGTGTTTLIGNITGAARIEALAFATDGVLYAAGSIEDDFRSESLFTLSVATAQLAVVGTIGNVDIDELTAGPDGFLYGLNSLAGANARLLKIDPATAASEDHGRSGVIEATGLVAMPDLAWVPGVPIEFKFLSQKTSALYRVRLSTPELIAAPAVGRFMFELIEASATQLYTFSRESDSLIVVDRGSGRAIRQVQLDQDLSGRPRGFALSADGVLYGVFPGMQLRTVDPQSGTSEFIAGITGAATIEAIAFSPDGTLYASGSIADNGTSESLFTLSTDTGELAAIGLMSIHDLDEMAVGPDGYLYGVDSRNGVKAHLWQIDPATAAVQDLGSTGVAGVIGLAVPRPPMLTIAGADNTVVVRWPVSASHFQLESSQSLGTSITWQPVGTPAAVIGDELVLKRLVSGAKQMFFRLSRGH